MALTQWADFRVIAGDPADNSPGVRGTCTRSAAALAAAWNDVLRWRGMIQLNRALPLQIRPTGEASAPLPTPADVVEAIGQW